jgi:hypothetical protein
MIQRFRTTVVGVGLGLVTVAPTFLVAQKVSDLDLFRAALTWVKGDQRLTAENRIGVDGERTGRFNGRPAATSELNQLAADVGGRVIAADELVRCKHPQVDVPACRLKGVDFLVSVRVVRVEGFDAEVLVAWERNEGKRVHAENATLLVQRTADGWRVIKVLLREQS